MRLVVEGRFAAGLFLVLLAVLVLGPWAGRDGGDGAGAGPSGCAARVIDVTDGDTVVVRLESGEVERVRYIGVDTPESTSQPVECFGQRAAAANRRLVGGRAVSLEPGVERRDDYGRLLAYVRRGRDAVNAELVGAGARSIAHDRPERRPGRAVREARAGRRSLGNGVVGPLLI